MAAAGKVPGSASIGPMAGPAVGTAPSDGAVELIDRLRRGDDEAFEALVRLHGPRMLAVARRYLPQDADAHDALQDAFVSVTRSIHGFQGTSRLETWLHRIVVNAALMQIRTRSRRHEVTVDDETLTGLHGTDRSSRHGVAADALEFAEFERIVHEELGLLPEAHRVVLTLRDVDGFDLQEVASLLDVNVATAKMRLQYARRQLRLALQRRLGSQEPHHGL